MMHIITMSLISQVSRIADSEDSVMLMLGRCLPHIVPNVLLAKREVAQFLQLLLLILPVSLSHWSQSDISSFNV